MKGCGLYFDCSGGCTTVFRRITINSYNFIVHRFIFEQTQHNTTKEKRFSMYFDICFSLDLALDIVSSELEPNTFEFQVNKVGHRIIVKLLESQEAQAEAPEPHISLRDCGQFRSAGEGMPFSSRVQPLIPCPYSSNNPLFLSVLAILTKSRG